MGPAPDTHGDIFDKIAPDQNVNTSQQVSPVRKIVPPPPEGCVLNSTQGFPDPFFEAADVGAMAAFLRGECAMPSQSVLVQFAHGYLCGGMPDDLRQLYEQALRKHLIPDPRIDWKDAARSDRWQRIDELLTSPLPRDNGNSPKSDDSQVNDASLERFKATARINADGDLTGTIDDADG